MMEHDDSKEEQQVWDAASLTYTVGGDEDGILLRTVMLSRLGMSRRLITRLKQMPDGITVNGERLWNHKALSVGDVVRIRIAEQQLETIPPEPIPIDVIYEDADILVLNKPPGIVVHPTKGYPSGTLANGVVHYWRSRGEQTRFRPVHRLDQDTSGVLLIAKHAFAHQQLSEQLQRGEVHKRYTAYVEGIPQPEAGTVDAPIDRDDVERHLRVVRPDGYPSITHYETIAVYRTAEGIDAAKVRCVLETGRTHQIRVHMRYIGCPLLCDRFYNPESRVQLDMERHALHAGELSFLHPMTGERMTFEAPLPDDLVRLERLLTYQ
ncbi:RluA family pseudouridine synthase [Paenibacillus marinisediminis]